MTAIESTDVVVLCGGEGKRLRSVVFDKPKPMADIDGHPFLELLVEHLAGFGLRRFIFCVGHGADAIERFFARRTAGRSVMFSREPAPLGTAGAVCNAGRLIRSDPFLILNGDSFCGTDLPAMLRFHAERNAAATIAVAAMEDASDYGTIETAADGSVTAFREKHAGSRNALVNAGVYVAARRAIGTMPAGAAGSLERDLFPSLVGAGLFAFPAEGPLVDIGTPERYVLARRDLPALLRGNRG